MTETGDPFATSEATDFDEERYRVLFEALPDGLLILDDLGRCVDVNPSLCRLLGRTRERLLGVRLGELAAPERAESVARTFERLKSLGAFSGELPLCAVDGTPLDLEWSSRSGFAPGLHLLAAHDVRARNQAERRLAAEHTVTRLLNEAGASTRRPRGFWRRSATPWAAGWGPSGSSHPERTGCARPPSGSARAAPSSPASSPPPRASPSPAARGCPAGCGRSARRR